MRKLKKLKKVMLLSTAFLLAGCSSAELRGLKIGTGGTGGNYYKYANELNTSIEKDFGIKFDVKSTAGSVANVRLISGNFLDVAIVQSDILELAANGTEMFADKGTFSGYSAVAALYTEAVQVIVSADSDITCIADLKGKSISVGEEDSGVAYNAKQILDIAGLDFDDIDEHYMSFSQAADAMRMGTIDGFFVTAGAPTAAIDELTSEKAVRFLSFSEEELSRLLNKYSGYTICRIPANTYMKQDKEIVTLGVKSVLIANNKLGQDTVKKLTEAVFKFDNILKDYRTVDGELTIDYAVSNVPISFHPGAADYYSDKGTKVNTSVNDGNKNGINAGQDD